MTLTEAKNFCRASDEDDVLVQSLIDASESYMRGAVDNFTERYAAADASWKAKADLARKLLITDWYENRLPTARPVAPAVSLLLIQLQLETTDENAQGS